MHSNEERFTNLCYGIIGIHSKRFVIIFNGGLGLSHHVLTEPESRETGARFQLIGALVLLERLLVVAKSKKIKKKEKKEIEKKKEKKKMIIIIIMSDGTRVFCSNGQDSPRWPPRAPTPHHRPPHSPATIPRRSQSA